MTIHTVRQGDSVYSIAREYGTTPTRIINDNLLTNPSKLAVGEDIVILRPTETHTVRGGETLSMIAGMYGVPLLALYRNNPILGGEQDVYPGQTLNIRYSQPPLGDIATNGYAYPTVDREVLRQTLPYLTYLSVFSYGIADDGALLPPEGDEAEVIALARQYSTIPLLVLTSLTDRGTFSSELAARVLDDNMLSARVIENAVNRVRELGYGGVDVDFEYLPEASADDYADFVSRLKARLGDDYTVMVSLAPKTDDDQPGLLYEGHNYAKLGESADRVLLMTYEWGYTYGPPLPVSPLPEVSRVVDYALSRINRDKILMGVPNYGYDWALPYVRGESAADSITNREAVELALSRNAEIQYDSEAQSPFFTYYDRPQSYSDAIEHEVWFENARSVEAKSRLAAENALYGLGVWNVMNFFPGMWTVVNSLYSIQKN